MHHLVQLNSDKEWSVSIKENKANRSQQQNAFFHACRDVIADEFGHDKEAMKFILKDRFLRKKEADGKLYIPETSSLNVEEMSELIEKTIALGMSMDLKMPDPEYYGFNLRGFG